MMLPSDPLVITYSSTSVAQVALTLLQQNDLRATLDGADLSTSLSSYGTAVPKCRLMIHPDDASQAFEILKELNEPAAEEWLYSDAKREWICERCDEPNQMNFDVCWNCQTNRTANAETRAATVEDTTKHIATEEVVAVTSDTNNPYAAPSVRATFSAKKMPLLNHRSRWVRATAVVAIMPYVFLVAIVIGVYELFRKRKN